MDQQRLLRLWERFFPARFMVDEALLRFNFLDCPLALHDASLVTDEGFVLVKASPVGRTYGDGPLMSAHVSALAFSSLEAGARLLGRARAVLSSAGFDAWQFGQDWRHFFPGAPRESTELAIALVDAGFETKAQVQFDVERDLAGYEPPVAPSVLARPCSTNDREALDQFFVREFPGRWRTDVMEKFGEEPHSVYGLFIGGACQGFAMTQREGDKNRRAGAVWSRDLGPSWGALGPIGVSKALRGEGHGHALLAAALCGLRDQGARRTIIDWTVLLDFYGRHGFEVAREYRSFAGPV